MHIKELILEGFKSYRNRTVVGPFDEGFNAITGPNGSGKSNLLDAICFVLGISKLSQVRVNNLQGLVYNGAGVTKASVTIVFDNSNQSTSPIGYEGVEQITVTRQVVIGGRNKYLINGHVRQQKQVQDLFHSVQLNVNNPHFLIMQGMITKVLNMNPAEILGLIEEAAGTRMYEDRKNRSLRDIAKKDDKCAEIKRVLAEEITPQMEKLQQQKQHYQTWSSINAETERLERFTIAFSFVETADVVKSSAERRVAAEGKCAEKQEGIEALKAEAQNIANEISVLTARQEADASGEMKTLEEQEAELAKDLVQVTAKWKNMQKDLASEQKEQQKLETQADKFESKAEATQTSVATHEEELAALNADLAAKEEALAAAQRNLQAVSAGMGDDVEGQSVAQKLQAAQAVVVSANSEVKVAKKKLAHAKKSLTAVKKDIAKVARDGQKLEKKMAAQTAEVQRLEQEVASFNFDADLEAGLQQTCNAADSQARKLRDKYEAASAALSSRVNFEYSKPSKQFKDSSVHGVVARLVTVQDPASATALEVTAGGKLFNVVVDNAETGKALLKKGKLKRRVNIIPLNQIAQKSDAEQKRDSARVARAESLGQAGEIRSALSLIGYDDDLENAMRYVFGSTLVCKNLDIAKRVTFDKGVKMRSVTLDGDEVNPAGTLSGGSSNQRQSILLQLAQVEKLRSAMVQAEEELANAKHTLDEFTQRQETYDASREALELAAHQLQLVQERISRSKHGQLQIKKQELESTMEGLESEIAQATARKENAVQNIDALTEELESLEATREQAIGAAEDLIKSAKKEVQKAKKLAVSKQNSIRKLQASIEQLHADAAASREQVQAKMQAVDELQTAVNNMGHVVASTRGQHEEVAATLGQRREEMAKRAKELKSLMRQKSKLESRVERHVQDLKKLTTRLGRLENEEKEASLQLASLREQHAWIDSEAQYFGMPGTDYDFTGKDLTQAKRHLEDLRRQAAELEKNINRKVMGMIQKKEQEYQSLREKEQMLVKDRQRIEDVIQRLDQQKREALEKTWQTVTHDFGSIFSTLLPGATAKLEPEEGKNVNDGLEVRVGFSGVWKESLTELSGGQRSLVALSLVLSLLRFKPAPMYILDEIDSALDLCHTQNIGHMLRTHFTNSQFVVVSLKDGMFNNANVIFRTQLIDGTSTVRRTVPSGSKAAPKQQGNGTGDTPAKKRSKRASRPRRERRALAESQNM